LEWDAAASRALIALDASGPYVVVVGTGLYPAVWNCLAYEAAAIPARARGRDPNAAWRHLLGLFRGRRRAGPSVSATNGARGGAPLRADDDA